MKKRITLLLVCICFAAALTGCDTSNKLKASMNIRSLSEKILDEADIDSVALVDDNSIADFLEGSGIDKVMLADHSINVPSADDFEILVILEAKKESDVITLRNGLKYINSKYDNVKSASAIVTKGKYVMLVNCEDNSEAQQIFDCAID